MSGPTASSSPLQPVTPDQSHQHVVETPSAPPKSGEISGRSVSRAPEQPSVVQVRISAVSPPPMDQSGEQIASAQKTIPTYEQLRSLEDKVAKAEKETKKAVAILSKENPYGNREKAEAHLEQARKSLNGIKEELSKLDPSSSEKLQKSHSNLIKKYEELTRQIRNSQDQINGLEAIEKFETAKTENSQDLHEMLLDQFPPPKEELTVLQAYKQQLEGFLENANQEVEDPQVESAKKRIEVLTKQIDNLKKAKSIKEPLAPLENLKELVALEHFTPEKYIEAQDLLKKAKKACLQFLDKEGNNPFIEKKLSEILYATTAIEHLGEQLFAKELKNAPLAVRKQYQDFKNLIGVECSIPTSSKLTLLMILTNENIRQQMGEILLKAFQQKQNPNQDRRFELGTDMVNLRFLTISEGFVTIQNEINALNEFFLGKVDGGITNTQMVTDEMMTIFPDARIDGLIGRHQDSLKNAQKSAPYLPLEESNLAKQGFKTFSPYSLWIKNQWTKQTSKNRLMEVTLESDLALKRADGSIIHKKFTTTLDLSTLTWNLNLDTPEKEKGIWELVQNVTAGEKKADLLEAVNLKKLDKIPNYLRPLLNVTPEEWSQIDQIGENRKEEILKEYQSLIENVWPKAHKFEQQVTNGIKEALQEPTPPPPIPTRGTKIYNAISNAFSTIGEGISKVLANIKAKFETTPNEIQVKTSRVSTQALPQNVQEAFSGFVQQNKKLNNDIDELIKKLRSPAYNESEKTAFSKAMAEKQKAIEENQNKTEQLFNDNLQKAPKSVRQQFTEFQSLVGKNSFIPLNIKFLLLEMFSNPELNAKFNDFLNEVNNPKKTVNSPTGQNLLNLKYADEFSPLYSNALEYLPEEYAFASNDFSSWFLAKLGQEFNVQPVTDSMETVFGVRTDKSRRHQGALINQEYRAPYMSSPEEQAMSKDAFRYSPEYGLYAKNKWEILDSSKISWEGTFAIKQNDGTFKRNQKTIEIDFSELGNLSLVQRQDAMAFLHEWTTNRVFQKNINNVIQIDLTKIDKNLRSQILDDKTFWESVDGKNRAPLDPKKIEKALVKSRILNLAKIDKNLRSLILDDETFWASVDGKNKEPIDPAKVDQAISRCRILKKQSERFRIPMEEAIKEAFVERGE